ncbi:MAG: endonuclease III [Acidimicrobiales bacterium]|jgi:endonuclease-3
MATTSRKAAPASADLGGASSGGAKAGRLGGTGRPRSAAGRTKLTALRLQEEYPGTAAELCELDFSNAWQLLVATVLSAQTTDERVNSVTPALFSRYERPEDLAGANPEEIEELIKPTGFFRNKTKSLLGLARALSERFAGEVPRDMAALVSLPGVGRKTANVVLSVGFGLRGLPVDTHVIRLSRLLGLTAEKDPDKIEWDLGSALPGSDWGAFSLRMILHGRRVCIANRPRCAVCVLADFCPSAKVPVGTVGQLGREGPPSVVGGLGQVRSGGRAVQRGGATSRSNRRLATPRARSSSSKSVP